MGSNGLREPLFSGSCLPGYFSVDDGPVIGPEP